MYEVTICYLSFSKVIFALHDIYMHMTVSLKKKKNTTNEKVSGDVTVDKLHTKSD